MRFLILLLPGDADAGAGEHPPLRFETFLEAFYLLHDAGADLVIASPDGGYPTMAWHHDRRASGVSADRFKEDRATREALADTLRLEQIVAEDFDGAYCVGEAASARGGGTPEMVLRLSRALLEAGKPVVCVSGRSDAPTPGQAARTLLAAARPPLPERPLM